MKKRNPVLFLLRLALSLFSCHGKQAERKSFHYSQWTQTDYIGQYCYKDSYFATDSTLYNPSLSTCSLSFAISCFGSNRNGSTNDYSKRYRNAEEFLTQNGFTDFDTNIYYKQKPSTDSLGAVFAKKKLGHIDPITMNNVYNFRFLHKDTAIYGITGYPLEATDSPVIHNEGYRKHGMNAVYIPIRSATYAQRTDTQSVRCVSIAL